MRRAALRTGAALCALVLSASACVSDDRTAAARTPTGTVSASEVPGPEVDADLRSRLPQEILDRGELRVRVDPTVAPFTLRGEDGTGHRGAEVELVEAVAARWGLRVSYLDHGADRLAGNLGSRTEDVAIGGLLVRDELREDADFVTTVRAGVWWAVRPRNPLELTPGSMCGHHVAAESGTWIRTQEVVRRERVCNRRGNPLRTQSYAGQDQATAALVSGKVDALVGPGPAIEFAVRNAGGSIEALGREYFLGFGGIAVRQDEPGLATLLASTLIALRADGTYARILATWGLTERAGVVSVVR